MNILAEQTWSSRVHTHLKGRIFNADGTSYLVLSDPGDGPDRLRVKALNAKRTVYDMTTDEVARHVAGQDSAAESAGR